MKERRRKYYLDNKEREKELCRKYYLNNKKFLNERSIKYYKDNKLKCILIEAKRRALRKNIEYDLNENEIFVPDVCPILGTKFENGTSYAFSIDRKDNSKGYKMDNVQIISNKANIMKSDATNEELVKFAEWIIKEIKPRLHI